MSWTEFERLVGWCIDNRQRDNIQPSDKGQGTMAKTRPKAKAEGRLREQNSEMSLVGSNYLQQTQFLLQCLVFISFKDTLQ